MRIGIVSPDIDRLGWDSWIELVGSADYLGVDAVLLCVRAPTPTPSFLPPRSRLERNTCK